MLWRPTSSLSSSEHDSSVFFVCKYKKIALKKSPVHRRFITLPHSDKNPSNTAICLILPDLSRSVKSRTDPDVDKQAREWEKNLMAKFDLKKGEISKILTFTQMTREYSRSEDKAKLSNTYDIFLVANKIMLMAFNFLGTSFKRPGKMLFPVHPERSSFAQELQRAYSLVNLPVEALKDTVSVRIGNMGQDMEELTANLEAIVEKALEYAPGGEKNIRACYVQLSGGEVSLPVYVDFGSANEVELDKSSKWGFTNLPKEEYVKPRDEGRIVLEGVHCRVEKEKGPLTEWFQLKLKI